MTGAPLPQGADAVVPVEDTDFNERSAGTPAPVLVHIYRAVKAGDYVRPAGEDVRSDETVLPFGRLLLPQDLGFLAMLGVPEVCVRSRPKVGILSTGDELLPLGEPLVPGKIYNSNTTMLVALVEKYGGEAHDLGIAGDDATHVQALLDSAVEQGIDLILSSAGVSVGAFDFVRTVVEEHGRLDFWRVNMRPGKPLAFGEYREVAFIGLPGNPVSAFVGFEVFVRDAILCMCGRKWEQREVHTARLLEDVHSDGRESYLRAVVQATGDGHTARLTGHQGSGNLRSLVRANALLVVPSGVQFVPVGEEVQYWPLDGAQV
jgi:molybdopterin molybdotransferase